MDPVVTPMADLLSNIATAITAYTTHIGSVFTLITGQPILLLGMSFFILGGCVSMVRKLIKTT